MRADSAGLFWEDVRKSKVRSERVRGPHPPIPNTGWLPPTDWPNLSAATVIGFDVETFDPELLTAGPGWSRNSGHLIGASLAVEDGTSWYFPMRHETCPEYNMDPNQVIRFLDHTLHTNIPKIGANLIYDAGWCKQEGIRIGGRLYDVQFAEALLNSEVPDVSLEGLSRTYLGIGKESNILYDWLARWLGGAANDRQRKHLYLAPPQLAGPYAQSDAALPIRILQKQWPKMHERGVLDLFDLECRLIPLLVEMRFRGAPVFLDYAEQVYDELGEELDILEQKLKDFAGQPVNPNAGASVGSAFKKHGIPIPMVFDKKTGMSKSSFSADLLEEIDHPIPELILEYRRTAKVRNTFVKSYIIEKNVNGRVHCSFHPLRGEGRGARSGRFSSADPNLQNIPVRSEIGKKVRRMFGKKGNTWIKWDFSQIEYRMLAHHAVGPGSDDIRRAYNDNPDIDYHEFTGELIRLKTGIILDRRPVKNINFGIIYGMGKPKLVADLIKWSQGGSVSKKQGEILYNSYHEAVPFAKATMDSCANEVHRLGYVETILGRKSDFSGWTSKQFDAKRLTLDYAAASSKWGPYNIERSHTHKALNRKLQGGAADMMKKAMVDAYEAGFFADDVCGMPCLTVHDELDFDFENGNDLSAPYWKEFKHLMENAISDLRVPVRIDSKFGDSWGVAD
jgi:DNA polymerase I-like protein with 3'-5' exonuclease and polymerase domains